MEISKGAAQTYAWLQALAASSIEARSELRTAGVPLATAFSLYPIDFSDALPGLRAHLSGINLLSLLHQRKDYAPRVRVMLDLLNSLPPSVRDAVAIATDTKASSTAAREFQALLHEKLEGAASRDSLKGASSCSAILWQIWVLMPHLQLLDKAQREALDDCAYWIGANLLKLEFV